ncbi:MAG: trigger factor [Flavobacteriales bacterium]|nr:trigger factor [Flavobacteriales bacterium]
MNVVEEKIDDLNAVLRVTVSPEDYQEKVNKTLKDYSKQANIPGFRPGKIPFSLIKKKYGKSVLAEELNKVINQSLHDFIQTNQLNILGNPLPKDDEEVKGDFDNPSEFEFAYEIGVSPEFDIKLSKKNKFDYLKVEIDGEMLDKEVDNLARRYGKLVPAEEVGEKDMVLGEFAELDGKEIKEEGIKNTSTISMEFVEDEKVKKQLTGKKVGAELTLDPRKVSKGDTDMAAMLAIKTEEVADLKSKFNFKITEIKTMVPAAIDQALFDKLFGEGNIKSEDELRDRIKDDLSKMFSNDSDRAFSQKVTEQLMEKTQFDLPEAFLKRWIAASSEQEITAEQIEADFENYRNSLKWQLIQNKIIKDNDIKVEPQEAVDYTKGLLVNQFAQYGMPAPEDQELEAQAKNVLGNREEANKIYDNIYGAKMLNYFKNTVGVNEKELPYDKFIEEAYGKQ